MAATKKRITIKAGKGSNTSGQIQRIRVGSEATNSKLFQFKAQNHLSYATNQKVLNAAKMAKNGNFVNGTINTVPYFQSWFLTGSRNSIYGYSMVGHSPAAGGTTTIGNLILPLEVQLTDANGNVLYDFTPVFVNNDPQGDDTTLFKQSPLFVSSTYNGVTGQIVDTAQKVEFNKVGSNWHTPLAAPVSTLDNPNFPHWYSAALDPTAWAYLVDQNNNIVGVAFDINVISNVFETMLQIENGSFGDLPNSIVPIILTDFLTAYDPAGGCCVLGYHTAETGINDPSGISVWTWGTWIPYSPDNGFTNPFGGFGYNSMVLSHEISELYNDPFVNTNVAPWVSGGTAFAQQNLETGDVIEDMAVNDVVTAVPLNTTGGPFTYNLQNVALLDWFTRNPYNGGIYSWPNMNTLNQAPHAPGTCAGGPTWTYGQGSGGFFFCNSVTGW
jgi:hypothetical protein